MEQTWFDFTANSSSYQEARGELLAVIVENMGASRVADIQKRIFESRTIGKLIHKSNELSIVPTGKTIINNVNSIWHFMFRRNWTLMTGGIYALDRWTMELRNPYLVIDDRQFRAILLEMLEYTNVRLVP